MALQHADQALSSYRGLALTMQQRPPSTQQRPPPPTATSAHTPPSDTRTTNLEEMGGPPVEPRRGGVPAHHHPEGAGLAAPLFGRSGRGGRGGGGGGGVPWYHGDSAAKTPPPAARKVCVCVLGVCFLGVHVCLFCGLGYACSSHMHTNNHTQTHTLPTNSASLLGYAQFSCWSTVGSSNRGSVSAIAQKRVLQNCGAPFMGTTSSVMGAAN